MKNLYQLGGKKIRSLLGLPSGIIGTKAPTIELLANTNPWLGFITTKSISALPKQGHKPPIFAQYKPHSGINAVGLDNPGAEEFAEQLSKIKLPQDFFLLGSIFGATPEEFFAAAMPLLPFVDGFELNFSCSHSKGFGLQIGQDLDLAIRIIEVIVPLGKPVFIKMSPKMDIGETVRRTRGMRIAGYTVINTFGPEPFMIDGHPVLTNKMGSLSGKAITEIALDCIRQARRSTKLPIIGCGGISTGQDVRKALQAGANSCAIGTGLIGMSTARMIEYGPALMADIKKGTERAERILEDISNTVCLSMAYRKFTVAEKQTLADDLFLLRFNQVLSAERGQGQFVFVWIPGKGERPFSALTISPLSLLISVRGECTRIMSQLKAGDSVYVRGPHGTVPKVSGKILLVGGGTGVAGLYLFAKEYGLKTVAVLGAKDKAHLFDAPFKEHCKSVHSLTETEDTAGNRGLVTDYLEAVLRRERPDFCLNCGPMEMVKKAIQIEEKYVAENQILSSIDSYTACGVGICDQCATLSGFRPCVDGTFLTKTQLGF